MGTNRDCFEIVGTILKASESGAGITKVINFANLSYGLAVKYLKTALDSALVELDEVEGSYKTTKKGMNYLENFSRMQNSKRIISVENQFLASECQVLAQLLLDKENLFDKRIKIDKKTLQRRVETANGDIGFHSTLPRIDCEKFGQELQDFGFSLNEAIEIISWIETIHNAKPSFFSGKTANHIKVNLAYLGARIFAKDRHFSYRKIRLYYNLTVRSYGKTYLPYFEILQTAKPDVLKLKQVSTLKNLKQSLICP